MKRQIRRGVFETNSSSTHSLTIVSQEEYDKWKKGEMLIHAWDEELISKDDIPEDKLSYYKTYNEYWDNCDLETFEQTYTTKGGEKIVAFGEFGYDG